MTAAAFGLQLVDPGRDLVLPRLRLVERRLGPLLLRPAPPAARLGGADHLGGVGVDDVQEAHRRQHVAGVAAGEQQGQRRQRRRRPGRAPTRSRRRPAGSRPARPGRRRRPSARRRPPAPPASCASRAATTSPCCACSPDCTSAARFCSSSSARLSSTPEVPPGWSLGSAAAGPPAGQHERGDAAATRTQDVPRVRHRGAREHRTTSAFGAPSDALPTGPDGVLDTAVPPGERR